MRLAISCFCAVLVLLAGCGDSESSKFEVSGVVRFEGQPITSGIVMYVPEQGPAALAPLDTAGQYRIEVVAGTHRVAIQPASASRESAPELRDQSGGRPLEGSSTSIPRTNRRYDT